MSLYGLAQAGLVLEQETQSAVLKKVKLRHLCADRCIYVLFDKGNFFALGVYVDDILTIGIDDEMINDGKRLIMCRRLIILFLGLKLEPVNWDCYVLT